MKQALMITLEIDREATVANVLDWMKGKIAGSKITEVSIKNIDYLYCGALDTFLADLIIVSIETLSADEIKHIFNPHPHFIHKMDLKLRS